MIDKSKAKNISWHPKLKRMNENFEVCFGKEHILAKEDKNMPSASLLRKYKALSKYVVSVN